jgi:hypothetical protein
MIVFFMSSARRAAESVALVFAAAGPTPVLVEAEPVTAVEDDGSEPLATGTRSIEVDWSVTQSWKGKEASRASAKSVQHKRPGLARQRAHLSIDEPGPAVATALALARPPVRAVVPVEMGGQPLLSSG